MKQFFLKISLFCLPFVVLSYPLDVFISNLLKQSNEAPGEYEVMNDIYSGDLDADIAIYGSSRAWVHINPELITAKTGQETYNFGIDGHNFWMQYLRHLEFLKHNDQPKMILLSVDVYTFQKETNLYYQNQFLPYMLWNDNVRQYTSSYNGFSIMEYYVPLLRYAAEKEVLLKSKEIYSNDEIMLKYRTKGFKGMDKHWNQDYANAKAKEAFYTVEIHEPSIKLFRQFLEECAKMEIEVVMVYTPEHVLGQEYIANRKEIFEIFHQMEEENDIAFLDYSGLAMCADTSYFYNASHLNLDGTAVFNSLLVKDLLGIGLIQK